LNQTLESKNEVVVTVITAYENIFNYSLMLV